MTAKMASSEEGGARCKSGARGWERGASQGLGGGSEVLASAELGLIFSPRPSCYDIHDPDPSPTPKRLVHQAPNDIHDPDPYADQSELLTSE